MANTDPFSALRGPAKAAFFEPYARLVQLLYARARGVIFYDANGRMVWQQKDVDVESTLSGQVRALIQEAADPEKNRRSGSERVLSDSTPAYLLWLRDEREAPLGILGVTCKPPPGRTPAATIGEVEKTLQPVLQCIARELATLRRIPQSTQQDQTAAQLRHFEWLADKALPLINAAASAEPMRELLAAIVSRTDAALGAVVVPDSSIRIIVESPGWSSENAKDALRRAHRQVLSWVQLERRTFLSSKPFKEEPKEDTDDDAFGSLDSEPQPQPQSPSRAQADSLTHHVIAAPILQRPDQPIGYVALLRSPFASEFGDSEQQLLERIGPLIPALIERDYDPLTSLRSAPGLERAARVLAPAAGSNLPTSVIFFDIVGLSAYNRDRGGAEADRLIRHVAKLLRPPQLPDDAISARIDGGHFACLLPRHDAETAGEVAERVREAASKQNPSKRATDAPVELRSGVAAVTPTAAGLRYALVAARAAAQPAPPMIAPARSAKASAVSASQESLRPSVPVRLREALRDSRLKLYAQPMRPVRDPKRPVRLELLPRILDDEGKLIAPAEFLSTGSDRDALTELDRWVMSTALSELAARSPRLGKRALELSLNISPRSLEVADFHDWMAEQLRREVVPAEQWLFEIAETTAANHGRDVARFAKRMLRAGARIVIDNVGGAACGRLQAHGASSIKMDGNLLRDVVKDVRAQRLVEALTQWASASRMDTVAAQVEDEQVRDWLIQLGIDYIQGYVISKPQPIAEVLDELLEPSAGSALFGS